MIVSLTTFSYISSSIGAKMVKFSNISPVTAREVLAVGPQSVLVIETALITLAHLAVHSEDVEVEVCPCGHTLYCATEAQSYVLVASV